MDKIDNIHQDTEKLKITNIDPSEEKGLINLQAITEHFISENLVQTEASPQ